MNLRNKVIVVTGASKGIGKGIAKKLAQSDATVVLNYRSDKEGAEDLLNELGAKKENVTLFKADVSNEAEAKKTHHVHEGKIRSS